MEISNMDDFKTICIYENYLVFAYFLINGRFCFASLGNPTFSNVPETFLTLLNYERYLHVCIFSLSTFHLFPLSEQASIAMRTILISKSWGWLLKPKRLTSTLIHNKFTYLDYVFLLSSYVYIYIYIYMIWKNRVMVS